MTDDEIITYLANILSVSKADGTLTVPEQDVIEEIVQRLGVERALLHQAIRRVSEDDAFEPVAVGRFSDNVKNLEDMMWVSLADGEMSAEEKPEILAFARAAGLSQHQLRRILAESRQKARSGAASVQCPRCSALVPPPANFCPECGTSMKQV